MRQGERQNECNDMIGAIKPGNRGRAMSAMGPNEMKRTSNITRARSKMNKHSSWHAGKFVEIFCARE
jgi:hypothetical protein